MTATTLDDLKPAEQLLLLSCRRSLPGRVAGPCVELAWRLGCGDRLGALSSRAFTRMTCLLDARGRRALRLLPPHGPGISTDECTLLGLVAACQCGSGVLAASLASWLVPAPHQHTLLAAATSLAVAMRDAGLELRDPAVFRADFARCA